MCSAVCIALLNHATSATVRGRKHNPSLTNGPDFGCVSQGTLER